MRRECLECFPCHRLQRNPRVSDPVMHHGTCVTHVPWCESGSLIRGGGKSGGKNDPGIPGACATRNCTYLTRGPWIYCYSMCKYSSNGVIKIELKHGGVFIRLQEVMQNCDWNLSLFTIQRHSIGNNNVKHNSIKQIGKWRVTFALKVDLCVRQNVAEILGAHCKNKV